MTDLTTKDLKQLLAEGRWAAKYAWNHYEELAAREATYTLYGALEHGIGAARPGRLVSKRSRILKFNKPKSDFTVYELDSEYKLLRVSHVINSQNYDTYHCFELNGILYACPFRYNQKEIVRNEVLAIGYKDGKPYYFGAIGSNRVSADFYEYISPEKVHVVEYSYHPVSKYSLHGYLLDPNAPLGELSSPAQRACCEEKPMYTDFSMFFRGTETVEQEEKVANHQISDWIDNVLNSDIPDKIAAFCFNLYEKGNGSWSMELVGASRFDLEDEDWPCDEITDFDSRKDPYKWEMDCTWQEALAHIVNELKEYLTNGKHAELLKSRTGVGIGFVDGDIEILHSK